MLPTHARLPAHTRFSKATVIKTSLFLLRFQPNLLETSRFGFVVSKKVSVKAVDRNRLKRVFRGLIEEEELRIARGNDLLFVLSPQIKERSREEIKTVLFETLRNHKLLT